MHCIKTKKNSRYNRLFFGWGAGIRTPEMLESESSALPLGYTPEYLVGIAGFEPTNDGVKVRCLTAWLYPSTA